MDHDDSKAAPTRPHRNTRRSMSVLKRSAHAHTHTNTHTHTDTHTHIHTRTCSHTHKHTRTHFNVRFFEHSPYWFQGSSEAQGFTVLRHVAVAQFQPSRAIIVPVPQCVTTTERVGELRLHAQVCFLSASSWMVLGSGLLLNVAELS